MAENRDQTAESHLDRHRRPLITSLAFAISLILFLLVNSGPDAGTVAALETCGWRSASQIWDGAWWSLVTSAFLHVELWHLGFNLYWLWKLGSLLEVHIGSAKFLAFVLSSAFVSSSMELALSGDSGIGFSGVVYAIFGLMWLSRDAYPAFKNILDARTSQLFMLWLVGCIFMTYAGEIAIGNAAHVSGLLFGGLTAPLLMQLHRRRYSAIGIAVAIIVSVVSLVWAPWQVEWLAHQAYAAHKAGDYQRAIGLYNEVIERRPKSAWAYANRSVANEALGETEQAERDFENARAIDPAIKR